MMHLIAQSFLQSSHSLRCLRKTGTDHEKTATDHGFFFVSIICPLETLLFIAIYSGLPLNNTRYMFYRSETPVDYNNGELTNWVRIELSKAGEPVIHSFPASPEQVKKYMGNVK